MLLGLLPFESGCSPLKRWAEIIAIGVEALINFLQYFNLNLRTPQIASQITRQSSLEFPLFRSIKMIGTSANLKPLHMPCISSQPGTHIRWKTRLRSQLIRAPPDAST